MKEKLLNDLWCDVGELVKKYMDEGWSYEEIMIGIEILMENWRENI